MKLYVTALMVIITCTIGSFAEKQPYWSLSAGWAQPNDANAKDKLTGGAEYEVEFDAGYIIEGALGVRCAGMPIAIELALSYLDTEDDFDDDVTQWSTMLNGMYFLDLSSELETYLLGGVGIISTESEIETLFGVEDIGDTVFGAQLGVGISQAIDEDRSLNLEYKYLFANDFEGNGLEIEQGGHSIQLGYTRYY